MERVARRNSTRLVAGGLLAVVGLARGIGGFAMMVQGSAVLGTAAASDTVIRIAGLIAFLLSGCAFVAGVFLIRNGGRRLYGFAAAALVLVFLDSIWNGWLLFGTPRLQGQVPNAAVTVIVLAVMAVAAMKDRAAGGP